MLIPTLPKIGSTENGIEVLDHIVIESSGYVSLKESGLK